MFLAEHSMYHKLVTEPVIDQIEQSQGVGGSIKGHEDSVPFEHNFIFAQSRPKLVIAVDDKAVQAVDILLTEG